MRTTPVVVALAVLVLDQLLKRLAVAGAIVAPWIDPAANPDFALGVAAAPGNLELVAAVVALCLAWAWAAPRLRGPAGDLACGLVLGGAAGNIVDRAFHGAVIDFLVGPGFLFNPADVALALGVLAGVAVLARRRPDPAATTLSGSRSARPR